MKFINCEIVNTGGKGEAKDDGERRTRSPDLINQVTFCEETVQVSRFKL